MLKQVLIAQAPASIRQNLLSTHKAIERHHALVSTFFANPHIRRIVDVFFLELERPPVIDVVADVLFIGEHLAHGT